MSFEWDASKAASNLRKHDVDFEAAANAFEDPFAIDAADELIDGERRYNRIGMAGDHLIVVTYTWRGENCRIISARKADRHERRHYHEA